MPPNDGRLVIEHADILPGMFRNFSGRKGPYNLQGDREFSVLLDPETAQQMIADGWNIKRLKPRGEETEGDYYVTVKVGFKVRPPRMVLISSQGRVDLTEKECELLDWVDMGNVDLIIYPRKWDIAGTGSGIKAYLMAIFITKEESVLDLKYADVPYAQVGSARSVLAIESHNAQGPAEDIVEGELVD